MPFLLQGPAAVDAGSGDEADLLALRDSVALDVTLRQKVAGGMAVFLAKRVDQGVLPGGAGKMRIDVVPGEIADDQSYNFV